MILGRDIHPEKKVYHTGALILQVLKEKQAQSIIYFELYTEVHKKHGLSMNAFTLALDWLFLLGVIVHENGEVKKCF